MSRSHRLSPKPRRLALRDLLARPGHVCKLSPRVAKALTAQIGASGLYPPLIVRPHRRAGKFEILDGHLRARILKELGWADARCEVWPVDDNQAEIYAATLNQLSGQADAKARARLIRRLIRRYGRQRVAELLALTPAAIRQQLASLQPPQPQSQHAGALDLRPVWFHLPPADLKLLEETLRGFGDSRLRRGQALIRAIRAARRQRKRKDNRHV